MKIVNNVLKEVTNEDVKYGVVKVPGNVKFIGNYSFAHCENLQVAVLPVDLVAIGNDAFYECSNLGTIIIPDGVEFLGCEIFAGCKRLQSITLPEKLNALLDCTFLNCESLTSLKIPDSVTSVGQAVFYKCTNLKSVEYRGVEYIVKYTSGNYPILVTSGRDISAVLREEMSKPNMRITCKYQDMYWQQ